MPAQETHTGFSAVQFILVAVAVSIALFGLLSFAAVTSGEAETSDSVSAGPTVPTAVPALAVTCPPVARTADGAA